MTIHFAAAKGNLRPRLSPAQARAALSRAANDNRREFPLNLALADSESEAILNAALRQFAAHGLGAAAHARTKAEAAFFAGERQTYQWWLAVCRTLDRRMAVGLARSADQETAGNPRESA